MVKITHERWKCIGCQACVQCEKYWKMDDDGKSRLIGAEYKKTDEGELGELTIDDAGCNKEAEANCPVQCIHVKEGDAAPTEEKKEEAPAEEKPAEEAKPSE
jgi:ferredoxin